MVNIKEAGPGFPIQFTESLKAEQNNFARFLEENSEAFDRHSFLTYELRDEEGGWKNSPTLVSVAEKVVELAFISYPQLNNLNTKKMRLVRRQIKENIAKYIFGNSSQKDRLITNALPQSLSIGQRLKPQDDVLAQTLNEIVDDFRTSYHEATAPLASGIRESKAELMGKFEEFLLSNSSNIFTFGEFLSDKRNHGAKTEAIKPFLASLVDSEQSLAREKKEGILSRVVKQWTDELKEKPNPATIDEFTASIKSPNILEWLEFAAQGEDIANFLKSRPDVSTWTSELRKELETFVSSRYFTARSSIEKELGEFRRPIVSKSLPPIDLELGKAKRTTAIVAVKEPGVEEKTLEKVEKEKYPIGILTKEIGRPYEIRVLTEEELTGRLQKEADSLDPADQRMMADLEKIFLSLREDPYGLGTKKLQDRSTSVGNRSLPVRSINPRKRIGPHLEHPVSQEVRVAYVIYKNGEGLGPVIGIEGIYKHEDYDRKFGS